MWTVWHKLTESVGSGWEVKQSLFSLNKEATLCVEEHEHETLSNNNKSDNNNSKGHNEEKAFVNQFKI